MADGITIHQFHTVKTLHDAVAALIRKHLKTRSASPHALMLSGGHTPLHVYQAIAQRPSAIADSAYLTYTDDRHVPVDSPDSNYGNTLPMIQALGLPEERVIRIHPELALEDAAQRFHEDFVHFFADGGRIHAGLLGLGPDGHTCSLFTREGLDRGSGRYAIPTYREPGPNRVSVTPDLLERIERVIFLVAGEDKMPIIEQLRTDPASVIAGQAVAGCPFVELWYAV